MKYDVIVVGAGPAGLEAAVTASERCRVLLLDSAPLPGGQYWRHRPGYSLPDKDFQRLQRGLSKVDYRPNMSVWFVEPGFTVHAHGGAAFSADRLVIATGAYDRALPFPGWDLPGVVTAGGAQALLKGQGVAIGQRVVVAGAGPFLLPVATGLARAGVRVVSILEAGNPLGYLRRPDLGKVFEALGYGLRLVRHRIPYVTRNVVTAAHGEGRLAGVTVAGPGGERVLECDALAVGYGFTPQIELAVALGCETTLDGDGSLVVAEQAQAATAAGVFVAGEVTGVGGAALALVEGRLAGLAASGATQPEGLLRRRDRLRLFAALMNAIHRVPAEWPNNCSDETVLCRCESVPAGSLRQAVAELGVVDTRGAKLMTRVGMGWCQGRVCGYAASHLTALANGRSVAREDLLAFANRPIAQPVTVGELAATALPTSDGGPMW